MMVVDSVGWIAFFAGHALAPAYRDLLRQQEEIVTPAIVLYEVYKFLLRELGEDAAVAAAAQMLKTKIVSLDSALAVSAAEISITHKLPTADSIVYATALMEGATVATSDAHFQGLPKVDFIPKPRN